jgi:hypothetical protein
VGSYFWGADYIHRLGGAKLTFLRNESCMIGSSSKTPRCSRPRSELKIVLLVHMNLFVFHFQNACGGFLSIVLKLIFPLKAIESDLVGGCLPRLR